MKMVPLFKWVSTMRKEDESKYVDLFKKIKISEGFYFSYTYDLTHTLYNNVLNKIKKNKTKTDDPTKQDQNFQEEQEESSDSEEEANG